MAILNVCKRVYKSFLKKFKTSKGKMSFYVTKFERFVLAHDISEHFIRVKAKPDLPLTQVHAAETFAQSFTLTAVFNSIKTKLLLIA